MDEHGISPARRHFLADHGAHVVPVLVKNGFAERVNAAWGIRCAFRRGKRSMRLRFFAHERGQVHEHRIVALGAANPQIFGRRLFGLVVDGLWLLTGKTGPRLAHNFLAGRAGTLRAEHKSGDVFRTPLGAGPWGFRCCFRRQNISILFVKSGPDERSFS